MRGAVVVQHELMLGGALRSVQAVFVTDNHDEGDRSMHDGHHDNACSATRWAAQRPGLPHGRSERRIVAVGDSKFTSSTDNLRLNGSSLQPVS